MKITDMKFRIINFVSFLFGGYRMYRMKMIGSSFTEADCNSLWRTYQGVIKP
jgi:hypothetical protein